MVWVVGFRVGDAVTWQVYCTCGTLKAAIVAAGECAKREGRDLVGVFRNREGWEGSRGRYLIDKRDKSKWPILGCRGLIDSLDSSWF